MSEIRDNLIPTELEHEVKKSFIAYSMAVIVNRALPDVRDGLKPVHRRILYAMNELGMTSDKPYRKSARIVGDVLGKYHPHGEASVYDAMVRLAQDFSTRCLLVDGQGNFGSVDGDQPAAMRYTEARMSKIASHLIGEIDKDTVDFYPNFDESLMQPTVLPSRFPNLLVNGSSGIAVGMATNVPPHNLGEVISGTVAMIDNPDITLDELMEHIKGPDFPTGAIILGRAGIREAYYTGRGRIIVRAKADIETLPSGRNRIVITEIPYMVNKARMITKIAELVHEKRLDGISDIRDESDRDGMRVVIELKRDAQSSVVLNYLYKHTQLQETFGAIMLALVDGQPRLLNLKEMIHHYILHQEEVVTRRTRYDLDKSLARAHILEGLLKALDNIDAIVHLIRHSRDTAEAKQGLITQFEFSDKQAQAILDMRLARLTNLEADKLQAEFDELQRTIAYLQSILADEHKLLGVIKEELIQIRDRFSDARRTEISLVDGEIDIEELIPKDDMVVTLSHFGYVKRLSLSTYRAQNRGGKGISALGLREEDYTEQLYTVHSHDDLLFFTDQGRVYNVKCYEIPEASRTARGTAIVNVLPLFPDEKVTGMIPVLKEDRDNHYLVMATRFGLIKKTPLSAFRNIRRVGMIAITLREGDSLIGAELIQGDLLGEDALQELEGETLRIEDGSEEQPDDLQDEDDDSDWEEETFTDGEVILGTRQGKAIRFSMRRIRASGRTSMGVRSIRLDEGDEVVSMASIEPGAQVLVVTENGYGKRSAIDEYRITNRGGKGIKATNLTEKTGLLSALLMVQSDEDIMIITDDGTIIRTPAEDVRETGRAAQGVRLMRVAEGSVIVDVARAGREPSDEEFPDHHREIDRDVVYGLEDEMEPSEQTDQEIHDDTETLE
ncbi:MAG: DNA gyrase subunit A [Christensenellales bacterium]|jgi:DNA gyrase subunit A